MSRTINRVELLGPGRGRTRAAPHPERNRRRPAQAGDRPPQREEGESHTDWHTVVCWAKQAEAVAEYVRSERVYVSGRLQQQSWETDQGERRSRIEVHDLPRLGPQLRPQQRGREPF